MFSTRESPTVNFVWDSRVLIYFLHCPLIEQQRLQQFLESAEEAGVSKQIVKVTGQVCHAGKDPYGYIREINNGQNSKSNVRFDERLKGAWQAGRALNHVNAIYRIAHGLHPFGIIFESDVILSSNFIEDFQAALFNIPADFDMVWLARSPVTKNEHAYRGVSVPEVVIKPNAYLLTKEAAQRILRRDYRQYACRIGIWLSATWSYHHRLGAPLKNFKVYSIDPEMDIVDSFVANKNIMEPCARSFQDKMSLLSL
jgi:hypothetical protein